MNWLQGYLLVGALLLVGAFGTAKKWPNPIELVVGFLLWPVSLFVAIKQTMKGTPNAQETKPRGQGSDPHPPTSHPE